MKTALRKIHRWLGLLMVLQIIAWMASGLYFALYPIETIRGEHLLKSDDRLHSTDFNELVPVWVAWNNVAREMGESVVPTGVELAERDGKTWYRVAGTVDGVEFVRLVNGFTGQLARPVKAEDAARIVSDRLAVEGQLEAVEWVSQAERGAEFRGRRLPLWRVRFSEPEALRAYVDPYTGEIVARRTTRWRIFDFLWMLHIMDFGARENFNTLLLQMAAGLGLLIALSGVVYWSLTTRLLRRKRSV